METMAYPMSTKQPSTRRKVHRWKPGESGNPHGAQSSRPWLSAVQRALARGDFKGKQGLNAIADKLVEMALSGDMQAIREIGDRLDGKAIQVIAGDPDRPLIGRQASEAQLEAIALGAMKVIEAEVVEEDK